MKVSFIKSFCRAVLVLCAGSLLQSVDAQKKTAHPANPKYTSYLFVYFTGNARADESVHFALSNDGYHYRALNNNQPVLHSADISETGGIRDPHILRGADGKTFYMVATDMVSAKGWSSNRGMVLLKSFDLIHWTSSVVNIQKKYAGQDSLLRVWAPQTIYDDSAKKYLVYFSLKYGKDPDKIYYGYANPDFTDLDGEPKQLFYNPDNSACIDGDIAIKDGKYYLFFKTEDRAPGIKIAVSDKLTHGYKMQSPDYVQQTGSPVEGAGTFKLNDGSGYILMYDMYTSGRYQFTKTKDLLHFNLVDEEVSMNFHPRHGTVMPITLEEAGRLSQEWLSPDDVVQSAAAEAIRQNNTVYDTAAHRIYFSAKPGTALKGFNPRFTIYPGTTVKALSVQDFTKAPVRYTVNIGAKKQTYNTVDIPCAPPMHDEMIEGDYEHQTGFQILNCFKEKSLNYREVEMIFVGNHSPFTWGKTPQKAVYNSAVLESVAQMAFLTEQIKSTAPRRKDALIKKHFGHKHGPDSYYGQ